jgi:hypothetical protein
VSGERGACDAPLSWAAAGRGAEGWALASKPSCGGEPVALHVFTCAACAFDAKSAVTAAFHFSCQSLLLEALAVPAHPAASTSARAAPLNETVAPAGRRLASIAWTLGVALSILHDNTTAPPAAVAGYVLSSQALEVATAAWGAAQPGGGGGALQRVQPASAAVRVAISMPLQPFVVTTTLTPLVPLFTLLANLVGLAGLLGLFSFAFGFLEDLDRSKAAYEKSWRQVASRWKAGRGGGSEGGGGAGADAAPTEGAPPAAAAETEAKAAPEGWGISAAAHGGGQRLHLQRRPSSTSERHGPAALPGAAAETPPPPPAAGAAGAPPAGPHFFSLLATPGSSPPPPERARAALSLRAAPSGVPAGAEEAQLRSPRPRDCEREPPPAAHARQQRADGGGGAGRGGAWESKEPAAAGALGSRSPRSEPGGAPAPAAQAPPSAQLLAAPPQQPLQGPELPGSLSAPPQYFSV